MKTVFCGALFTLVLAGCGGGGGSSSSPPVMSSSSSSISSSSSSSSSSSVSSSSSSSVVALKSLAVGLGFPIGMAVSGPGESGNLLANTQEKTLVAATFNSLVAGNIMKMSYLDPGPTQNPSDFTFANADLLMAYVQNNSGMVLHGHTLIWHADYQVPTFMKNFPGTPTEFAAVLKTHVQTICSHFAGHVISWDVVNEAIDVDNTNTAIWRQSVFYTKSGNSAVFIENAFKDARAADGAAKLYYNDYNIEWQTPKLDFLINMVNDFKTKSIPIDGIGFQMHVGLTFPSITSIRSSLQTAVNTGLLVKITELDVAVNGNNTLTSLDTTTSASQKQRYHDIVKAYLDIVPPAQRGGITVWGITDGESWINQPGHPDWPLMYNNDYTTKPAYDGVVQALQGL